jgi:hypothetical protein
MRTIVTTATATALIFTCFMCLMPRNDKKLDELQSKVQTLEEDKRHSDFQNDLTIRLVE